jgi:RNA polymerase sigma factor (sigma-70 family)
LDPRHVHATHFKAVYRFFYYREVDGEEIEDLCQDTFFRFFQKYGQQELDTVRISKTLYVIARNVWREWLRLQRRTQTEALFEDELYAATFEAFGEEELEKQPVIGGEELRAAIAELNPTLRTVITLRFLEGKTRQEVADALGTKEKYVHIYQQRGIKALQKLLAVSPLSHTL